MLSPRRAWRADLLGLGVLLLLLLDYLRPSLILLPTVAAGGDTPCHYPTLVYFYEHLLPRFRLHGWYPGAYLGHPLLLYYFPLPFLLMSTLVPFLGLPVAFKVGTALGVFLLPLLAYASLRLMGFLFPAPLLGSAAAMLFLFVEDNPIWGGTLASTLTGEFAYTYGIGLAALFLGFVYRVYSRGGQPWAPAALLAVTGLAHGYAVLWAGLSTTYFLYSARRPARTLAWLLSVAGLAFALAAFWLLPLLAAWGWTTPYDDPWITVSLNNLLPPLLWPVLASALAGLVWTLLMGPHSGGPDHRLLFLLHSALVAAALAAAGPALGVIDVRFVPFAHLAAALAGGAVLGMALQLTAAPRLLALGLVLLAIVQADRHSQVLRYWVDWNYSGLEAKPNWTAFREVAERLQGTVEDPRIAVEYGAEHEKAGSIRMYETLPLFSGRSTLEGVYNQASLHTHPVYYLASELDATAPNPFRNRSYSHFDTDGALDHLRLFNVREVVAVSPKLTAALEARSDVESLLASRPYAVFRLKRAEARYVEPLAFAPVRSSPKGWREKAYRWFTRKPLGPVHLVFSDDPRFEVVEKDAWLAPPAVPLETGVELSERVGLERIDITTSRVGHPLLVKVSYHPRWWVEGADGPYLVSPAMMMVIPRQSHVRLLYGRALSDNLGLILTAGALLWAGWRAWRRRRAPSAVAPIAAPIVNGCDLPAAPRRWGGVVPAALLLLLVAARFRGVGAPDSRETRELYERASRAYAAERYADAAEYARHILGRGASPDMRAEVLCLRGESLLRVGRPHEAAEVFQAVVEEFPQGPYVPQALYGGALAHATAGDGAASARARERLLREFSQTPWARRIGESAP